MKRPSAILELLVEGAADLLHHFKYVKTEVAHLDPYIGCCKLSDLLQFMKQRGFKGVRGNAFKTSPGTSTYYNIFFRQNGVLKPGVGVSSADSGRCRSVFRGMPITDSGLMAITIPG